MKGLEGQLTAEERREVVQEGVEVMRRLVEVVEEIAAGVETSEAEDEGAERVTTMTTAAAMVTPQMTVGLLLLLSILKMLGIGGCGFPSELGVGFGVGGRRSVA